MLALTNGKLYTIANGIIHQGTILINDGKIVAVGQGIEVPCEAQLVDLKGQVVIPGMVDPSTRLGIHEEGLGAVGYDEDEATTKSTPQLRVIDAINPIDIAIKETMAAGVTTVAVTPGTTSVIGGQISVIKTYGQCVDKMVIKETAGLRVNLSEAPQRARGDAAAIFLDELQKARNYLDTRKPDDDKLNYDLALRTMVDVLEGRVPVFMQGVKSHDILNAIELAEEWGFKLIIERGLEAHLVVDEIKQSGAPLIIGSIMGNRRGDTRTTSHRTPGITAGAGILTALSTEHPATPAEHALVQAALARREGMTEEDTLAALTLNPAKVLGLDDRIGSIEVGKDADLVVVSGHPLSIFTRVGQVYVNGQLAFNREGGDC